MSPAERTKTEKNDGVEKQEEHFKPEIQETCAHTFQCSMYVNKKQTNKQKNNHSLGTGSLSQTNMAIYRQGKQRIQ